MSARLFEEGVFAQGIGYPTVAEDKARVRTIVTATHTRENLDAALAAFETVGREPALDLGGFATQDERQAGWPASLAVRRWPRRTLAGAHGQVDYFGQLPARRRGARAEVGPVLGVARLAGAAAGVAADDAARRPCARRR